ncbi:S8 family peptidase [Chelativorans sp. AA-79]|uniref:S8 family peptidase n=1 Tax=Chelativorans sp. AA-79 TaxID=3028735 RepID=UPI0023F938E8|nr:S8 family peptidase [Chelativorans sp. AA-79]WEX08503.1 S8 family peptidase [Chelativorans sp. AA-79]
MPRHEHLPLLRLPETLERRKTGYPGPTPWRGSGYGGQVRRQVEAAIQTQQQNRPAQFIDPSLILRVRMQGMLLEPDWEALGLTLLSSDDDRNIILFSSQGDLTAFLQRLDAYDGPIPDGQQGRRYEGFVTRIENIGTLEPRDRLGMRIREAGFTEATDLQNDEVYTVDIELWDFGTRLARERKARQIEDFITGQNDEVFDVYLGPSITLMRVRARGQTLRPLLSVPEVAFIDLPPVPDIEAADLVQMELDDAPEILPPDENAPVIGVLDSGVNDHPFLEGAILERLAFPAELGTADVWGHGTRVGGAALYGDLRDRLGEVRIQPVGRLVSAKVVGNNGRFYERRTLPTQMRETIIRLRQDYGCRIFVMSLGDVRARNEPGRVGPWAATLDELARELDVMIFVSTGNRAPRSGMAVEQGITHYPGYLLEPANRLCEPAGAANIVTVGSLANGTGLGARHELDAHVRPITGALEPSPFSRAGPGAGGIRKPDFVDVGGTMVFDAPSASLQWAPHIPEAGIITLNHEYLRQLITSGTGTSYAAPILANKAAALLRLFPHASANLIRALLAGAASVPEECEARLRGMDAADKMRICGNGLVDVLRAAYSDDHRVVLYAEDRLAINHFAVYRVPIPQEFQTNGRRTIRVSLAFDPPVRRTRAEYIGTKLNFRLLRGCPAQEVFAHFRARTADEGDPPDVPNRFRCDLKPGPQSRDGHTLQTAAQTFVQDTTNYGDEYYLVVRCAGGWAEEQEVDQRFAVVVELEHQPAVQLYARLRQRVRV